MDKIYKDTQAVRIIAASARGERLDSELVKNTTKLIADLANDPSPDNKYRIGQLVGFAVNEIVQPQTNWMDSIADVKRLALNELPEFNIDISGVKAFVQAKGSTTPRSKVASKKMTLETIEVSARPVVNVVELANGMASMDRLIRSAAYEMEMKYYALASAVLSSGMSALAAPYYGTGTGIVNSILDPMIQHWQRMGGAALLGDISIIGKLAEATGFTAATGQKQFAESIITEQNNTGMVGVYKAARVINLLNPYMEGTDVTAFDRDKLFILPTSINPDARPLKIAFQGDVTSIENTNIDDKTFETRLDQWFGCALVYGDRPYLGMYQDDSIL